MFLVVSLLSSTAFSNDGVWVAITVNEGRCEGCEYSGLIDQETFDSLTNEIRDNKLFKLSEVFWINDEGKIETMSTTNNHGHKYGYKNTVYFREDKVFRIIILDKKYIDTLEHK